MDGPEPPDTNDEFDAEVSDLRGRAGATSTPSARSLLQPRLTPPRRLVRLAVILSAGLVLVVTLGSIPAVRNSAADLARRFLPPATPTLVPGSDLFTLLPNPPGVDVSLDGQVLAQLPAPGAAHPLRLAPGRHVYAWQSHIFPFPPLQCSVSVPPAPADTCPIYSADALQLPQQLPAVGQVIALHPALGALPADARDHLVRAIQGALDAGGSTALVQPGERYSSASLGSPVVATQPLRATLTYVAFIAPGEPCSPRDPALPCRFPGQDCTQLCTVPQAPPAAADGPFVWIAAALVGATWSYTTLGGQVVADHIPDAFFFRRGNSHVLSRA